jgi:hypothetical protein
VQELATQSLESSNEKTPDLSLAPCAGPLFVVGMFRSGTSLLYALLNQHPQIALIYEGDLAHVHSLFWFCRNTRQWLAKWNAWNGALTRHKLDTSNIPDGIFDLKNAVRAVYTEYARQKKGATIWGCKSPTYYDEITRLSRTFPNARFIIIWRDLRDICGSIVDARQQSPFFDRRGMLIRAMLGYHEMKVQCDALVKRGGSVHQLNYEDLVQDPGAAMKAICVFLGIPFDSRMTRLEGADHSAIDNFRHHALVKSEKIIRSGKSQTALTPALRQKIEAYICLWRKQYGDWPSYSESISVPIPSIWQRFKDRVYYKLIRTGHHATPVVFSLVPSWLWAEYRKFIDARRFDRLLRRPARSGN